MKRLKFSEAQIACALKRAEERWLGSFEQLGAIANETCAREGVDH
ncbi:hypothetical protein [Sphingomonas hengshuiensis]|nr:hypothetical protein [Sphingomonas hengshuiensis]